MANRLPNNESLHDRVIQAAVNRLDNVNYDIYTNPGRIQRNGIGENYPDIILTKKGQRTVEFIIEVETADSVNISEATNQWKKYANEIKASFYILVPFDKKNLAISLCKQIGISARFGTYQTDFLGNVTNINYE
jgi:hypothetical protein